MQKYYIIPKNKIAEIEGLNRNQIQMSCQITKTGLSVINKINDVFFEDVLQQFEVVELTENDFLKEEM